MADDSIQMAPRQFLRPSEVAEILRVKPKTLANWRSLGKGPEWRRHGGLVVYPREGLDIYSAD